MCRRDRGRRDKNLIKSKIIVCLRHKSDSKRNGEMSFLMVSSFACLVISLRVVSFSLWDALVFPFVSLIGWLMIRVFQCVVCLII